jgi:hypothetical protein
VNLGFAREGLDQSIGFAGHETGEVGNGAELFQPVPVLNLSQRRR